MRAFAAAGDIEPAKEIGRGLTPVLRAYVLTSVARALAAAGHTERARTSVDEAAAIMGSASDRHSNGWVLADIAVVLAHVGWTDRAEALGNSLTDPTDRGRALAGVATALARSGMTRRAGTLADEVDALARSMSETDHPERLLCDLATGVQPERARQRLARALLSGGWRTCLEALAHVDPRIGPRHRCRDPGAAGQYGVPVVSAAKTTVSMIFNDRPRIRYRSRA